jgi:uncharacterized protein DUF6941
MARLVLPRVQAMVLCDEVDRSAAEHGVYHLTGVRNSLALSSFPATRFRLNAFVHMSGHEGEASCQLQIFHLATDSVIYLGKPKAVSFKDPTLVVPVVFPVRNCVFAAPGVYFVEVLADNKVVGERRLHLLQEE